MGRTPDLQAIAAAVVIIDLVGSGRAVQQAMIALNLLMEVRQCQPSASWASVVRWLMRRERRARA
jgi:hypothetical protein